MCTCLCTHTPDATQGSCVKGNIYPEQPQSDSPQNKFDIESSGEDQSEVGGEGEITESPEMSFACSRPFTIFIFLGCGKVRDSTTFMKFGVQDEYGKVRSSRSSVFRVGQDHIYLYMYNVYGVLTGIIWKLRSCIVYIYIYGSGQPKYTEYSDPLAKSGRASQNFSGSQRWFPNSFMCCKICCARAGTKHLGNDPGPELVTQCTSLTCMQHVTSHLVWCPAVDLVCPPYFKGSGCVCVCVCVCGRDVGAPLHPQPSFPPGPHCVNT